MSNIKSIAIFAAGAVFGSLSAWIFAKRKYEKIAQEEIDSVKAVYKKRYSEKTEKNAVETAPNADEHNEYNDILTNHGYTDEPEPIINASEQGSSPYVITPDDFNEYNDYDKISLTYYDDGLLADDDDILIEDVEMTVGSDSLKRFGEFEDDAVFVRNDTRRCDYEILRDLRKYADVIEDKPYKNGGIFYGTQ